MVQIHPIREVVPFVDVLCLDQRFLADPDAARRARHSLKYLHGTLPFDVAQRLSLLVTELVNNGVLHGRTRPTDSVGMRVWASSQTILVEVTTNGCGFKWTAPAHDEPRVGGWGLVLVERQANRWGIQPGPPTTVWFEIACEAA